MPLNIGRVCLPTKKRITLWVVLLLTTALVAYTLAKSSKKTADGNNLLKKAIKTEAVADKEKRNLLKAGLAIHTSPEGKTEVNVFGKVTSLKECKMVVGSAGNTFSVRLPQTVAFQSFVTGEGAISKCADIQKMVSVGDTILCGELEIANTPGSEETGIVCNKLTLYDKAKDD